MWKSPAMKLVHQIVWLVTALYALNVLTMMFGIDMFGWGPLAGMKETVAYFVGICGLISLISWGMHLSCHNQSSCTP